MERRKLLKAALATTGVSLLTGCGGLLSEKAESTQQRPQNHGSGPEMPTLSWHESWLQGEEYAVTVNGELRDAEQISFKLNGQQQFASITHNDGESFSTKIAGKGTNQGPVTLGDSIWAVVPQDPVDHQIDVFTVGSQEQPSMPSHLWGLSGGTVPNISTDDLLKRQFEQTVDGRETVFTTHVPKMLYDYYESRIRTLDWGMYVSDGYDDPYLKTIIDQLQTFADRHNFSDRQLVNHTVALVQQMEYTQDKAATGYNEYPKFPVETLVDRGGDCEDSCILLAELLQKLGYGVVLLAIRDAQHMALGVAGDDSLEGSYYEYKGQRYYYLETTAGGWKVGQVPDSVRNSDGKAEIHEVNSTPVLAHKWAINPRSEGGVTAEVGMRNIGAATAKTAEVQVVFETKNGGVVASRRQPAPEIPAGTVQTVEMNLIPPDDETMRCRVRLFLRDKLHDESQSSFENPIER